MEEDEDWSEVSVGVVDNVGVPEREGVELEPYLATTTFSFEVNV